MDFLVVVQITANAISAAGVFALVSVGFGLVLKAGRFFHMAHGAVLATAPYGALAGLKLGLSPIAAAGVGLFAAVAVGAGLEAGVYRALRRREASSMALLIASLGSLIAWQNLLALLFGDDIHTLRHSAVAPGMSVLGARLTEIQLTAAVAGVLLITALGGLLTWTKLGQRIRAVADDAELALLLGVKVKFVRMAVMLLASVLGAVGALLVAYDTGFTPQIGFDLLLTAVVVAVVGGVGSLGGTMAAAFSIAILRELCGWYLDTSWRSAATFLVLIGFLVFRPRGIGGLVPARGAE